MNHNATCVLRDNMDIFEHKSGVLRLIFLKYISVRSDDKFIKRAQEAYANPKDWDEHTFEGISFVPRDAR